MAKTSQDLKEYKRKRNFSKTPEPEGGHEAKLDRLRFVVQKHAATRLHYDLRLEFFGDFKSWAVPKGPSLNPTDQRLAVRVENHPIEYGSFEGIIPPRNYGAGTVMIWDAGWLYSRKTKDYVKGEKELQAGYDKGHITFILEGQKLKGEFALIKLNRGDEKAWLLVKKGDQFSSYKTDVTKQDRSVATGRSMEEIAKQAKAKGEIWIPGEITKAEVLQSPYVVLHETENKESEDRLPHKIKPTIPVISNALFLDENWVYTPYNKGTRAILEVEPPKVELYSRTGLSLNEKFPDLVKGFRKYPSKVVLDGQIDHEKISTFNAWDVIYSEAVDYRDVSLKERLKVLKKLSKHKNLIILSAEVGKQPEEDAERILVRHLESFYRSGIQESWQSCPSKITRAKKSPEIKNDKKKTRFLKTSGPVFTNQKKVFWPKSGHTKGDVIKYYESVSDVILKHLKDRPMSMHRHPNGVDRSSFFQKDVTGYHPSWVETVLVKHSDKTVNYLMCQNKETLLYLANLGCIELNPWLSQAQTLEKPDWGVIDLDPLEVGFEVVIDVALTIQEILSEIKVTGFCKTSGSKGIHIVIPFQAKYSYDEVRRMIEAVCKEAQRRMPKWTSVERTPARRRKKVYLDYMQNVWGQTLASPYCLRPKEKPLVSAPLEWREINRNLKLDAFTIDNMRARINEKGDIWADLCSAKATLEEKFSRFLLG